MKNNGTVYPPCEKNGPLHGKMLFWSKPNTQTAYRNLRPEGLNQAQQNDSQSKTSDSDQTAGLLLLYKRHVFTSKLGLRN